MNKLLTNLTQELKIVRPQSLNQKDILVIVHGADGSVAPFYALAMLLNATVIAIAYEPFVVGNCQTIEAFAKVYWDQIIAQFPNRTYRLCGYSYGGLVAYEMAILAEMHNGKKIPVFMIDPNLPLAMRNYSANRLFELRVLAATIIPDKTIKQYDVGCLDEEQLMKLLSRCLKVERIEFILSARRHCLTALSSYVYTERTGVSHHAIHAAEKLGFDFIDEETKWITGGTTVNGNHFTMLNPGHVENIANIINSKVEGYL